MITALTCSRLSPHASSAGVAIAPVSVTPSSTPLPVVQSLPINLSAGIRGLLGNNVWSLDWPGDPRGLVPKLGTRTKWKSGSAQRVGKGAISQYNARTKMQSVLKQTALNAPIQAISVFQIRPTY